MINNFPPQGQNFRFLQTNRSDKLGSIWASKNLDFLSNLGKIRLAKKLVINTTSDDDADLGLPTAFEFFFDIWWAICGTRVFKNTTGELTSSFVEDTSAYQVGDSTTQFDVTNTAGNTYRYTFDATGTDPGITAFTFPIGATVIITGTNLNVANRGTFTVTGSGADYFEVTNASGVAESNKTINTGSIAVSGGTIGQDYSSMKSDLKRFNARLWSTTDDALWSKATATGNWTKRDSLSTGNFHMMTNFFKFDRLFYRNSNTSIRSIDTSDVVSSSGFYFLSLSNSLGFITCLAAASNIIWVGMNRINTNANVSNSGLEGSIIQWDGFSTQPSNIFPLPAGGCLALIIKDDVPYVMDSEGRLLKFTGYSFAEIARLPLNGNLLTNANSNANNRFIHFNGMEATKDNTIIVNINNLNQDAAGSVNENLPSGIWECDLSTGNFAHKYSPTLKPQASTGITDWGQNRVAGVGAIKLNTLMSNSSNGRSKIIAGFNYYTDASTSKYGIFIESPSFATSDKEGQKRGYVVTTWYESSQITDNWSRIWATFRKFLNATDKIILKYRFTEEAPIEATITWISSTVFETATDLTAYDPSNFGSAFGGEVEVLQGIAAGACAHITNIAYNGGTYTVTVDNATAGATGTAKARFQKWKKLTPEITVQDLQYGDVSLMEVDVKIQIKIVMEFTGDDEFIRMVMASVDSINTEP